MPSLFSTSVTNFTSFKLASEEYPISSLRQRFYLLPQSYTLPWPQISVPSNSTCHAYNFKLSLAAGKANVFLILIKQSTDCFPKRLLHHDRRLEVLFPEEVKRKRHFGSGILGQLQTEALY